MRENSNNSQTRNFEGKLNFLGQPHKKQSNKKIEIVFLLDFHSLRLSLWRKLHSLTLILRQKRREVNQFGKETFGGERL